MAPSYSRSKTEELGKTPPDLELILVALKSFGESHSGLESIDLIAHLSGQEGGLATALGRHEINYPSGLFQFLLL